jgi:hypothetical protein
MTAPVPLQGGTNPYTGMYMARQFDNWIGGGSHPYAEQTVFDQMVTPPTTGANADDSPGKLFAENTNPVDQHSSSFMTQGNPVPNPYSRPAGQ